MLKVLIGAEIKATPPDDERQVFSSINTTTLAGLLEPV